MNILKTIAVTGLAALLVATSVGSVYAQDEDSFIQEQTVSKRDAVVLSALFPGLGQMTQGQKVKGITLFMGEAISLMMYLNAHENYETKESIYSRDLGIYNNLANSGTFNDRRYSEALDMYNDLKDQNKDLDDLHTIRNTALIVAGTVYAANLIDAIFFSPSISESSRAQDDTRIKFESAVIDMKPGIMLTKRF